MLPIPPSVVFGIGRAIFRAASDLAAEYKAEHEAILEAGKFIGSTLVLCEAAEFITKERREYLLDGWLVAAVQGDEQRLAHFVREIQHEIYKLYQALIVEMERLGVPDKPVYESLKEQVEFYEKEDGQHLHPSSGADQ